MDLVQDSHRSPFPKEGLDQTHIEGLWEREAAPVPDPTDEQLSRARSSIIALSGLDEAAMAA